MKIRRRREVPLSVRFAGQKRFEEQEQVRMGSQTVTPPATLQSGEQKTKPTARPDFIFAADDARRISRG